MLCNYDFTNTSIELKYQPNKIIKKGKLTIGIIGVGIEMKGLVPDLFVGNLKHLHPVGNVNTEAAKLKKYMWYDMVISLSHLGH